MVLWWNFRPPKRIIKQRPAYYWLLVRPWRGILRDSLLAGGHPGRRLRTRWRSSPHVRAGTSEGWPFRENVATAYDRAPKRCDSRRLAIPPICPPNDGSYFAAEVQSWSEGHCSQGEGGCLHRRGLVVDGIAGLIAAPLARLGSIARIGRLLPVCAPDDWTPRLGTGREVIARRGHGRCVGHCPRFESVHSWRQTLLLWGEMTPKMGRTRRALGSKGLPWRGRRIE